MQLRYLTPGNVVCELYLRMLEDTDCLLDIMQRESTEPGDFITEVETWLEGEYPGQVTVDRSNGSHMHEYVNTRNDANYIVRLQRIGEDARIQIYPADQARHLLYSDPSLENVFVRDVPNVEFGETVNVSLACETSEEYMIAPFTKVRIFRGATEHVGLEFYSSMPLLNLLVFMAVLLNLQETYESRDIAN
jgi:hypothetical protein